MTNSIEALNGLKTTYTQKLDDKPSDKLDNDDFMNLLVTQLKYQDPLEPLDNNEFIAQTTSFSQLEELSNMSKTLSDFTNNFSKNDSNNNLLSASSFLGKEIKYGSENFELKDGESELMFNLPTSVTDLSISVYDSMGNEVSQFVPTNLQSGENSINWNGVGADGAQLSDGIYSFKVNATDANGEAVNVFTFAEGKVDSVSFLNGSLVMQVGNQLVDYNLIYSVSEPTES
jgi:flagellar basal-body rod modification protein FlgD